MKTTEIVNWYKGWTPAQGIDDLAEKRQHLAINLVGISIKIGDLEKQHNEYYINRKLAYAEAYLSVDGTVAEREAEARKKTHEIALNEAKTHGQLKGSKIYFDSLCKVLDSMAAWLNRERKL